MIRKKNVLFYLPRRRRVIYRYLRGARLTIKIRAISALKKESNLRARRSTPALALNNTATISVIISYYTIIY